MIRSRTVALSAALFLVFLTGCTRKYPITGSGGLRAISEVEILKSDAEDVLELIEDLRPSWLLGEMVQDPENPFESGGPQVLVNGVPPRPLFTLQFMSLENVREIHYLTSTSAETRYRVRSSAGTILVITHSRVGPGDSIPPDTGRVRQFETRMKLSVGSSISGFPHTAASEAYDD